MNINEGIILFSELEQEKLKKYFSKMNSFAQDMFNIMGNDGYKKTQSMPYLETIKRLQIYSDSINDLGVKIKFVFGGFVLNGYYDNGIIFLNLRGIADWNLNRRTLEISIHKIEMPLFREVVIHEYIHYKQDVLRRAKQGEYKISPKYSDTYWKQPWEHQAYAGEYLEKLKNKLSRKSPRELLKNLRRLGFERNSSLDKLKKTDYKSWKRVMKNAIMMTMANMPDDAELPWQKKELP